MARSGIPDLQLAALRRRGRSVLPLLVLALLGFGGCQRSHRLSAPQALRSAFALTLTAPAQGGDDAPMRALLLELGRLLPPKLKQRIGRPIVIEVDPHKAWEPISVPVCEASPGSPGPAASVQALGVAQLARHPELPHRILLHPGIFLAARAASEGSARFACGHKSLYRLALATCLHEVLHIYDQLTRVSETPAYRHLQQFARQGTLPKLRAHNQLRARSPDVYEFQDIAENLAVNFEYFILDPEFKCRRPAVYEHLSRELGVQPFFSYACAVNTLVYAGDQAVYIDPQRVYQIHYLFAGRGKGIASRFGHSMFRIVSCAPTRTRVDERCLEDLHDHVVLSFVANLREDLRINAWKGLTGKYMSQLIIRPLTEVLNDYTEIDHRDLQSVPLQLTAHEIQQFIFHALELYWGYSGRYYFLTNNCADESLRLVQSTLMSRAVQAIEILTPLGLRDELIKKRVADSSVFAERATALSRGYLFQSAIDRYAEVYLRFRDRLPAAAPRKLERYLAKTTAVVRRQWATALGDQPAALSGLFTIEGLILQRQLKEIERTVLSRILFRRDPRYVELGQKLKEHLRGLRLPWELVSGGYGIPLPAEFPLERRPESAKFPDALLAAALSLVKIDDATLYHEYVQTEQNRKLMVKAILNSLTSPAAGPAHTDPRRGLGDGP